MKKEYLIPGALILLLSAYLLFHKGNKNHYILPEIKPIDTAEITTLKLQQKGRLIIFTKQDNLWTMTENAYAADTLSIDNMLGAISKLKLSALISESSDLVRYELDDEKKIQVAALKGETVIFKFTMGKTAPSFNHTFVKINGDKNVYHADGSFRSYFEKQVDDFRDKKVLDVKEPSVKTMLLQKDGHQKTLTALVSRKKDKSTDENKMEKESRLWKMEDGTLADKEIVSDLLNAVTFVECDSFVYDQTKETLEQKTPDCTISLNDGRNIHSLKIYKPAGEKQKLYGTSSMSSYGFVFSSYNGNRILEKVDKLLGIEQPEEKKK